MKKISLLSVLAFSFFVVIGFTSCGPQKVMVLPTAINTVNSVNLMELNLDRADYEILDRITSEASITYKETNGKVKLNDDSGECEVTYLKTDLGLQMEKFSGFFKMGYLHNDYGTVNYNNPEEFARRLAIYRLINAANEMGADGIVEPIISTNVDNLGKKSYIIKTTVSGKIVKLKTEK